MKNLAVVVAILLASCASADSVKEGDRQLIDQNAKALLLVEQFVDAALGGDVTGLAMARVFLQVLTLNTAQLAKNFGPAKNPLPLSVDNSGKIRKDSEAQHATPWYVTTGVAVGGILLTILGNKFAPGLGMLASKITMGLFKSAPTKFGEAMSAGVEQYMIAHPEEKKKLVPYLERNQEEMGVSKYAEAVLKVVKTFVMPGLSQSPPDGAPPTPPANSA